MITGQGIDSKAQEARRISPGCTPSRIAVTHYIYNKIARRECDDCSKYRYRSYKAYAFELTVSALHQYRRFRLSDSSALIFWFPIEGVSASLCNFVFVPRVLYAAKTFPRKRRLEMMGRARKVSCRPAGPARLCGSSVEAEASAVASATWQSDSLSRRCFNQARLRTSKPLRGFPTRNSQR